MNTNSNRSQAVSRGNKTRAWRRSFQKTYPATSGVVALLASGKTTKEVADILAWSRSSVATVKANMTRGVYYPYVNSVGGGLCNYSGQR